MCLAIKAYNNYNQRHNVIPTSHIDKMLDDPNKYNILFFT